MKRKLPSFVLIALCALLCTCTLEKPAAPRWETQLNVPMIDRTYTIAELIEGQKELRSGPDGLLCFHLEKELDKTLVGDHLSLPDFAESFKLELDAFQIPDLPVQMDLYFFYQLAQEAGSKHGTVDVIAPFSFNNIPSEQHSTADLRYAFLTRGVIRIYLFNGLEVALQNVLLTLQDPVTNLLLLATPLVAAIAPKDTIITEVNAAGIAFPPNARWLISGNSPGSDGRSIAIDQYSKVEVLAELRDAVVSAAEARIPAAEIEQTQQIALLNIGQNAVEEVAFSSGNIGITIDNQTPFTSPDLAIQLPQFYRQGAGEPLQLDFSIRPFQRHTLTVDLTDVTAKMDLPQAGVPQRLQLTIRGETTDLREQFVIIDENTHAKIDVEMNDVVLDHFSGRLEEQMVRLDSTVKDIQISDRIGDLQGVQLADARMTVILQNTIRMPIRFQGALYGINAAGASASLAVDQAILPGSGSGETQTVLPTFTPLNSNLLDVINIQPTRLAAAGQVLIGDGISYGRVSRNDYIRGRYVLDLPIYASWQPRTIAGDTAKLVIEPQEYPATKDEDGEKITLPAEMTQHIISAKLMLNVENNLPVGGQVRFYFAADSTRLIENPDVRLDPVTIQAAPVDETGKATTTRFQVELEMTQEDIKLFQNEGQQLKTVYIFEELALQGTDGKKVKVYVTDYLRVQGLLNLKVYVGDL